MVPFSHRKHKKTIGSCNNLFSNCLKFESYRKQWYYPHFMVRQLCLGDMSMWEVLIRKDTADWFSGCAGDGGFAEGGRTAFFPRC